MHARVLGFALVSAIAAAGCGPSTAPRSPAAKTLDPRALVAEVAELRGLPDTRPTRIVIDEASTFDRALEAKARRDGVGPSTGDAPAFFGAFDFARPGARRGSSLDEVVGEQIIAFYDVWTHSVHVRADKVRGDDDPTLVLAHEIEHSLQVQNLPRPDVAGTREEDVRLAQMSILEGDAMLVMLADGAYRRRIPLKRALARAAVAVSEEAFDRYARASGADRALLSAPPLIRERLTFPYLQGLTFVGALWRAGGFPLVNRMFSHPPASSEHVLHPERYLAGDEPVPVRAPSAPSGWTAVAGGRVGELQLQVVLARCLPRARANAAAAGWGGDAYLVARAPDGKLGLFWSTVWDDEAEAREFESALADYVACSRARSGQSVLAAGDALKRDGTRVALSRGVSDAEPVLAALLALPEAAPKKLAPLGDVRIPPLKPRPHVHAPYVSQGQWVNERLGLMAAVPPGALVEVRSGTSATFELHGAGAAYAGIELSDQIAGSATIDEIHGALAALVRKALGRYELEYVGGQDVFLPALGHGVDRAWRVKGTEGGLRAIVVPICNGTGSLVLWQLWTEPSGEEMARQWLGSVRPTAWREPPVCAELDP